MAPKKIVAAAPAAEVAPVAAAPMVSPPAATPEAVTPKAKHGDAAAPKRAEMRASSATKKAASGSKAAAAAAAPAAKASGSKAAAGAKKPAAAAAAEPAKADEPSPVESAASTSASPSPAAPSGEKKSATPVPMKVIRSLQERLVEAGSRKYTQDELKNVLSNFWDVVIEELLDNESGHKVSFMNIATLRLQYRQGQSFRPPASRASGGEAPKVVNKPPRWSLGISVKEQLKTRLENEFRTRHEDIVSAYEANDQAYQHLAVAANLIKETPMAKALTASA